MTVIDGRRVIFVLAERDPDGGSGCYKKPLAAFEERHEAEIVQGTVAGLSYYATVDILEVPVLTVKDV